MKAKERREGKTGWKRGPEMENLENYIRGVSTEVIPTLLQREERRLWTEFRFGNGNAWEVFRRSCNITQA
jgi:hypothetical protein